MGWNILNQFKKELDLQLSNILSTSYTQGEGIYRKFIYPKKICLQVLFWTQYTSYQNRRVAYFSLYTYYVILLSVSFDKKNLISKPFTLVACCE